MRQSSLPYEEVRSDKDLSISLFTRSRRQAKAESEPRGPTSHSSITAISALLSCGRLDREPVQSEALTREKRVPWPD